ncbi:MAG: hypothetical protein R8G01_05005 [Ilumatobacteraceae bacterium]|nr:hypothetical protein [Ilumatobacteraceae bacterium]
MRRHSPIAASALLALALTSISACDPSADEQVATGCASLVENASRESEPSDQVRMLDRAMIACGSYEAFSSELQQYSGSIGYDPITYIERRCERVDDELVRQAPTCAAVIVPTTTAPPTTVVELLFVGDTVDGRPIEIRPGPSIEFVGDVPAIIQQTVDIAFESGCDGVIAQRDLWADRIDDSATGDIASVYAQHAQNVANFIGCETDQLSAG